MLPTVSDGQTSSSTAGSRNLTTKSYQQLVEMLQRENFLFENKNFLKRLPDGGKKLEEKISKILAELESRGPQPKKNEEGRGNRRLVDIVYTRNNIVDVDTQDILKQMKKLVIGSESKAIKPVLDSDDDTETEDEEEEGEKSSKFVSKFSINS